MAGLGGIGRFQNVATNTQILGLLEAQQPEMVAADDLKARLGKEIVDAVVEREHTLSEASPEQLLDLLITSVNGEADLPEQTVQVEYLKHAQKMRIPYALAMSPLATENTRVPQVAALVNYYIRVSTCTYTQLRDLVAAAPDAAGIRTALEALEAPNGLLAYPNWNAPDYQVPVAERAIQAQHNRHKWVYAMVSQACGFNCDLRDTGKLLEANMTMTDNHWMQRDFPALGTHVLDIKLRPFTLQSTAALNYEPSGNSAMGAWMRAYALAAGVLPRQESALSVEYVFSHNHAEAREFSEVAKFEKALGVGIYALSMNLMAVFGLLHLAKDHTYKQGNADMERIGLSYLRSIRTMVSADMMTSLEAEQEALLRTAPHPFGLGQTYFVARYMFSYNKLAPALAIRIGATPPPVQRLMVVEAASKEWTAYPIGGEINQVYRIHLNVIITENAVIHGVPPAYSGLWRIYGCPQPAVVTPQAVVNANGMMPLVYGYAINQHRNIDDKLEGLALALCFKNVKQTQRAAAAAYEKMWKDYLERKDTDGLVKFIKAALEAEEEMVQEVPPV